MCGTGCGQLQFAASNGRRSVGLFAGGAAEFGSLFASYIEAAAETKVSLAKFLQNSCIVAKFRIRHV